MFLNLGYWWKRLWKILLSDAALSIPFSLFRCSKHNTKKGVKGSFGVFAVFGQEGGLVQKKSSWGPIFNVEDPRPKAPQYKGKSLDAYQALEVARFDIQYLDWRARPDLITIVILHEKVVEVLKPLAREYKSIGTMKKDLAELQEALAQAHRQVSMASSSGDSWMKEYNEATKLAEDISGTISEKAALAPFGSESHRHFFAVRRKVTILGTRLDSLEALLSKLPSKQPITEKELDRQKDMLSNLRAKSCELRE